MLAFPQIEATVGLLTQTTRRHIGYATAGENSFFPAAAVLALFPMLMGNTTPNFYPQKWWGVWHLWEMLGYVGLVTLVLAAGAVWTLYRRRSREAGDGPQAAAGEDLTPIVRIWTWIGLGAGLWALGYYLPTYMLIHRIPLLGVVRCPARMLVVVDLALAVLAAVAVHGVMQGGPDRPRLTEPGAGGVSPRPGASCRRRWWGRWRRWRRRRGWWRSWRGRFRLPFAGGPAEAWAALHLANPAVWVPLVLTVATVAAIQFWIAAPARRWWAVILVLLLVDLFSVAGFVDVPADLRGGPDPDRSPAAAWMREHGPGRDVRSCWG